MYVCMYAVPGGLGLALGIIPQVSSALYYETASLIDLELTQ